MSYSQRLLMEYQASSHDGHVVSTAFLSLSMQM